ncbi:flagellar hook protein FlgE [Anaerovibrio lipolyticus]|jgi:flagellar hook protein FlgE|uniref:flagellar hook protein FlgE n=1 Tax=Anaerovibrio lipolyticus TaxID=82374 RepID=UPI0026F106EA|nr:flagellar hook protein FlgE [Anaerovibrio lipolyticus]MBE6106104.1 flagellar hook protein FlgE [Anaerovibrio lipolyticus]
MMRSLFSGVSGLKNHQTRMDVIGNNISNVNTTGFKSSRVNFEDSLSQTLTAASSASDTTGGTNPKQIGLGSKISAIDVNFKDGSVQSTGINTDLCLSGNALFVVKQGNQTFYTRNGAFNFDAEGNLVNAEGLYVQGYMNASATEHNSINTNGATTSIQIRAGKTMPSSQTQTANYVNNLNASAPTITGITATDNNGQPVSPVPDPCPVDGTNIIAAVLTMSDGTTQTVTSGTYKTGNSIPLSTTVKVYDSQGGAHVVPITIEKTPTNAAGTAVENTWVAKNAAPTVTAISATEITLSNGKTAPIIGTVEVAVGNHVIVEDDGTFTKVTMNDAYVQFKDNGAYQTGSGSLKMEYSNGNGASDQTVAVTFDKLTQYANSSTINAEADGYASGTLDTVTIDESGTVVGTYTNGVLRKEAQIAVAQFTNAPGLTKKGNSLYVESNNSGTPNIGTAGGFGATITASALEMSNVDVAEEFSNMIITQRGFQSNSKIITVSDEMLENLINMKR